MIKVTRLYFCIGDNTVVFMDVIVVIKVTRLYFYGCDSGDKGNTVVLLYGCDSGDKGNTVVFLYW